SFREGNRDATVDCPENGQTEACDQRRQDKARGSSIKRLELVFRDPVQKPHAGFEPQTGSETPQLLFVRGSRAGKDEHRGRIVEFGKRVQERAEVLVRALLGDTQY